MKTFKAGDYCLFKNEEIPAIIELLAANGWNIWKNQKEAFDKRDLIIRFDDGEFNSQIGEIFGTDNEISRHDFMVKALRLHLYEGMRSDMSTLEQRKHVTETLEKLGIYVYPNSDKHFKESFYFDGDYWLANFKNEINNRDYSEWCKRLNVEPIWENVENELQKEFESTGYASWIDADLYPDGKVYTKEYTNWLEKQVVESRLKNRTTDSVEKNQHDIIEDVLKGMIGISGVPSNKEFYAEFDFRCRAALGISTNTLTLSDGTTVDLTKPLQVSNDKLKWWDVVHFVGIAALGEFVTQEEMRFSASKFIRNKPEFKRGDKVWAWNGYIFYIADFISDNVDHFVVETQSGQTFKESKIRPAIVDGTPVYPPFND